jgi:hypothetical protein
MPATDGHRLNGHKPGRHDTVSHRLLLLSSFLPGRSLQCEQLHLRITIEHFRPIRSEDASGSICGPGAGNRVTFKGPHEEVIADGVMLEL